MNPNNSRHINPRKAISRNDRGNEETTDKKSPRIKLGVISVCANESIYGAWFAHRMRVVETTNSAMCGPDGRPNVAEPSATMTAYMVRREARRIDARHCMPKLYKDHMVRQREY